MMEAYKKLLAVGRLQADDLANRVAVISGAGNGIGRAAAFALAALGATVVIAEILPSGQTVANQIMAGGGKAAFIQTDVSSPESVARLQKMSRSTFGEIDILVNNAIRIIASPVSELNIEDWDAVMAVNLRGAFLMTKAFLPDMLARHHGTIINMVSTEAMPRLSAYIASKQGLVGFSQSLAAEVGGKGVRVVSFAPGMVDTQGIRSVAEEVASQMDMTAEELLGVSLHPAYEGLMPPTHAGVAAAYLVARLAGEYHGETVTGYEVLERAGIISSPSPNQAVAALAHPINLQNLLEITSQFEAIILETAKEFDQLPAFVRPIARSGFKGKTGMSIQDWKLSAAGLHEVVRSGDLTAINAAANHIKPFLPKLSAYYHNVPAETARFSRDQDFLTEVTKRVNQRIALVSELQKQL